MLIWVLQIYKRCSLKYLIFTLLFGFSIVTNSSFGEGQNFSGETVPQTCRAPLFLHPDAKNLTERFSEGEISYMTYLEQFIWLEPDLEHYALCIICSQEDGQARPYEASYPQICSQDLFHSPFMLASKESIEI
jgi:hypothetical protein